MKWNRPGIGFGVWYCPSTARRSTRKYLTSWPLRHPGPHWRTPKAPNDTFSIIEQKIFDIALIASINQVVGQD